MNEKKYWNKEQHSYKPGYGWNSAVEYADQSGSFDV